MFRFAALFLSAVVVCTPARAGDDAADLKSALALQRIMQKVIEDVEPAVACILVSRSDAYQRYGLPAPAAPGKLGGFNANALRPGPASSAEDLVKKLDLADPHYVPESFGSGVVIDPKGLILTNFHVVQDATKIFVRLPGNKSSYADIHAADARSDLAVLRLLTEYPELKPIRLSGADKFARGQFVLSIANPYAAGFRDGKPSASWGIISNVRRRPAGEMQEEKRTRLQQYGILLQTDARLNLGCSGGALVNLQGEVIGLTTALAAIHGGETPGGFAVPLDAGMRRIVNVLRRGEEVDYGFLGVSLNDKQEHSTRGAVLGHVSLGSPAERQGHLRTGDTIIKVNDTPVRDSDDLFLALGTQLAGAKVRLEVRPFHGAQRSAEVELVKFDVPGVRIASSLGNRPFVRGLRVDYTSVLVMKQQVFRIPRGVLVTDIQPFTAAATAKLKIGDVITRVNGRELQKPAEFYEAINDLRGPIELTLGRFGVNAPAPKVILP